MRVTRVQSEDFRAQLVQAFASPGFNGPDFATVGDSAVFINESRAVVARAKRANSPSVLVKTVADGVLAVEAELFSHLNEYRQAMRSKGWRPGPPPKDGKLYPVCLHGGEGFGLAAYSSLMGEWMTGYEDAEWASEDVFRYHWPDPISTPPGEEDLQSFLAKGRTS